MTLAGVSIDRRITADAPALFRPLRLRGVELRNRIGLAPMTQYSALEGFVADWHPVHYGARAVGTGIVMVEATAVSETGRVTLGDLGLWSDDFVAGLGSVAHAIKSRGAVPAIQLSHGGRKSSRTRPWEGDAPLLEADGGWRPVGPTAQAFAAGYVKPRALQKGELSSIVDEFAQAAQRAVVAGFEMIELHAGHGRLFHSFYSPESNHRSDEYGGTFDNRSRLLLDAVRAVRGVVPDWLPVGVRLSCVDWTPDGWQIEDSVRLATALSASGVDLIDCTSGGITRPLTVPTGSGYQVGFAEQIRDGAGVATAAVGLIESGTEANRIVESEAADLVLFGRPMLADPQFALRLAAQLGSPSLSDLTPLQYERGLRSLPSPSRDHIPEL